MDIVIRINIDNQAFEENEEGELMRILSTVRFEDKQRLVDVNGHIVGSVKYIGKRLKLYGKNSSTKTATKGNKRINKGL